MKIHKKNLFLAGLLSLLIMSTTLAQSLVPTVEYPTGLSEGKPTKIALVDQLPSSSWQKIMADVIKIILGVTGSLALVAFTVGGVMMVTAQGNEEKISKGKGILYWSVLALVIIAASYAVVVGITQLEFFQ